MLLLLNAVHAQQTVGLFAQTPNSQDGYVLFSPVAYTETYLIDKCGKSVHNWSSSYVPGLSVYLLEDGSLLRTGNTINTSFNGGGRGGVIEKYDWNNNRIWSYTISTTSQCQHHDICPLPNGNILVIVWEKKNATIATDAGRDPELIQVAVWSEKIIELQPSGTNSATIVWEWHAWDHLVQDFDNTKANFGVVSDHPELINLNFNPTANVQDWLHINSVAYNPALDQIVMSVHNFSEIWIIDHSTSTAEASTHSGGNSGMGGDLLYRWGNPQTYNRGVSSDQKFFRQHDAQWIPQGYPDENKILVYNNGLGRPEGGYSSVEIIEPPVNGNGNYSIVSGQPFLPLASSWTYTAPVQSDFYSAIISGAQRLSNGNTLICEGTEGHLFEIDANKNIVWDYINPVSADGAINQGDDPVNLSVFRCTLYEPDYPAFTGKDMTPDNPIELNPTPGPCDNLTLINSDIEEGSPILIFPNPFVDVLSIKANENIDNATIEISDVTGKIFFSEKNVYLKQNRAFEVKIKNYLASGLYFVLIKNNEFSTISKLVKHEM